MIYKKRTTFKKTKQTCQNLLKMNLIITRSALKPTPKKSREPKMRLGYLPKKSIISSKIYFTKPNTSKCIKLINFTSLYKTTNKKLLI